MEGVWTTLELQHAFQVRLKVMKVYEVWPRKEKKKGSFANYINKFFKVKWKLLVSLANTTLMKRRGIILVKSGTEKQ